MANYQLTADENNVPASDHGSEYRPLQRLELICDEETEAQCQGTEHCNFLVGLALKSSRFSACDDIQQ